MSDELEDLEDNELLDLLEDQPENKQAIREAKHRGLSLPLRF